MIAAYHSNLIQTPTAPVGPVPPAARYEATEGHREALPSGFLGDLKAVPPSLAAAAQ